MRQKLRDRLYALLYCPGTYVSGLFDARTRGILLLAQHACTRTFSDKIMQEQNAPEWRKNG